MICLSVLYANAAGKRFDYDYYARQHMPMVLDRLKPNGMTRYEIDRGLGGVTPGSPAAYLCIGRCYFDTLGGFEQGFAKHGAELAADIPNYTDAEVVLQVSETT
jgi:uncharacterized protein (TIGR02118 family)